MTEKINKSKNKKKRGGFWEIGMTSSLILLLLRIPLSRMLGNEGNGYFALSYEIFNCVAFLFIYGLSGTVTDLVNKRIKRGLYHNGIRVLSTSVILGIIISAFLSLGIYFVSDYLFASVFGAKTGALSLKVTALYLIPVAVLSCLRGFFEGMGSKMPTHYSKIIESAAAGAAGMILTFFFLSYGKNVGQLLFNEHYEAGFGAAGALLGYFFGIVISLLFMLVIYRIYQVPLKELMKNDETKVFEKRTGILRELFHSVIVLLLPVMFLYLHEGISFTLFLHGMGKEKVFEGIRLVGGYYGKVFLLLFLFVTLILGLSGHEGKKITYFIQKQKISHGRRYFVEDCRKIVIFSIPAALLMVLLSKQILNLCFLEVQTDEIIMARISSIGIIIIPLALYFYGILSAIHKKAQLLITFLPAFIIQGAAVIILSRSQISSFALIISELLFWASVLAAEFICLAPVLEIQLKKNK